MSDFSSQLEDLIEYKKLIIKFEEALKQKDSENVKITKINKDLTQLCEEMKSELNQQNAKLISQYTEIKNLTKKYEKKINTLNEEHEKERQKYDDKILELSSYNHHNPENQIKNELELQYSNNIKNKDLQILNLKNEIKELKQNLSLKDTELNLIKKNLNEQLYAERETHSFQMRDLLSKISTQNELEKTNEDKEIFEELKLTLQHTDKKNELLYKELDNLRNEKNKNEIEYNKKIFELETQLKEEKLNNTLLNNDIDNITEDFNKIKNGFFQRETEINQIKAENQKLIEENDYLKRRIEEKIESNEEIKKDIILLKQHIRKVDKNFDYSSMFIDSK